MRAERVRSAPTRTHQVGALRALSRAWAAQDEDDDGRGGTRRDAGGGRALCACVARNVSGRVLYGRDKLSREKQRASVSVAMAAKQAGEAGKQQRRGDGCGATKAGQCQWLEAAGKRL